MAKTQAEFGVIGLGRFGTAVATTLYGMGHSVLGVDRDMANVQRAMSLMTYAAQADATEEEALRSLGFRNFDTVVISVGPDQESSILATVLAKELGIRHIVAKARSPMHGKILERVGADQVVYPEREMGVRIAHRLVSRNILDVIELSEDMSVMEVTATDPLLGKSLKTLAVRNRYGVTVLAIRRKEELVSLVGAETVIEEGDVLIVAGRTSDLTAFAAVLAGTKPRT